MKLKGFGEELNKHIDQFREPDAVTAEEAEKFNAELRSMGEVEITEADEKRFDAMNQGIMHREKMHWENELGEFSDDQAINVTIGTSKGGGGTKTFKTTVGPFILSRIDSCIYDDGKEWVERVVVVTPEIEIQERAEQIIIQMLEQLEREGIDVSIMLERKKNIEGTDDDVLLHTPGQVIKLAEAMKKYIAKEDARRKASKE